MSLALKSRKEGEDSKEHLPPKKRRNLEVHTSKRWRPEKDFSSGSKENNLAWSDISDDALLLRVVTPPAVGIA
jgi:hypothetical protein